jgi:tRNA1Val (adenine37-N6)-methyltransferase
MGNPFFRFKQFTVWHDQCAMKVNTDGVLLGAWAGADDPSTILDIGTGSGLIALMMAQRFPNATIHAVEMDEDAYRQAQKNVDLSGWKSRVSVFHDNFLHFYKNTDTRYNLIVSNPPYFSNSLKNNRVNRTLARHNDSLPYSELIKGVSSLLNPEGKFTVILPADACEFESEASLHHLFCSRKMLVKSLPGKPVLRQLLEFSSQKTFSPEWHEMSIYLRDEEYSDPYIALTRAFYLNFK